MKLAPVSVAAVLVAAVALVLELTDQASFEDNLLAMGVAIVLAILGTKER